MSKGNRVKTIGKELFVWAILFASAYFLAEQLTSWFMTTSLGRFVLNINDDFGWVVLIVVGLWTLFSLMGAYAQYSKPLFIVGISGLLINYYGAIEVSPEIYLAYYVLLAPYLIRQIDIKVARLRHKGFLEQISLWIENLLEKCDSYWKKHTNLSFFKYDRFDADDKLHVGREQMVKTIVDQVRKLKHDDSSFTIGLEGGWGSGKTTLLNKIKSELIGTTDEHGMIVEVVEFSPWAYPDGKSLSVEFLYELRDVLSKHSFRARFIINAYINALADKTTNILQLLAMLFFPRESLQKVKAKLSDLLRFHRIKLVVIIDDLDRLDADEMAEVYKMLRNTGDLPNAVYLVAYSKNYISELLKDGNIGEGFLHKVINVEFDINSLNKGSFWLSIQKEVETIFSSSNLFIKRDPPAISDEVIDPIFFSHSSEYSQLKTVRGRTLYINSFRARVAQLEKIEGIRFSMSKNLLILLELIKIEDYSFYCKIKSGEAFVNEYSLGLEGNTEVGFPLLFKETTDDSRKVVESTKPKTLLGRIPIDRRLIMLLFLQDEEVACWIRDIQNIANGINTFKNYNSLLTDRQSEFMPVALNVVMSIIVEHSLYNHEKVNLLIVEFLDTISNNIMFESLVLRYAVSIGGLSESLFEGLNSRRKNFEEANQFDRCFNSCYKAFCNEVKITDIDAMIYGPVHANLQIMQERRLSDLEEKGLMGMARNIALFCFDPVKGAELKLSEKAEEFFSRHPELRKGKSQFE